MLAAGQNLTDILVEKVAAGYSYVDGPAWSREGRLLFADVPSNRLLEFAPPHPIALFRDNANGAAGNAYDAQGRLYTCETHARRVTRTDKKGKIEVLAERWQGKRFNAPNDIVVRKDGQVYFTDPAFGNQRDARELDFYGVFHVSPKGELDLLASPKSRPNGIALSPNGRTLYVSNSDERNVRVYELDPKTGAASNERVLVSGIDGVPNGMCVDENGNLYVAANKLNLYTSAGKSLAAIALSETPSNCSFGDADLSSLYVTARTSIYRLRLGVKGSVQY